MLVSFLMAVWFTRRANSDLGFVYDKGLSLVLFSRRASSDLRRIVSSCGFEDLLFRGLAMGDLWLLFAH